MLGLAPALRRSAIRRKPFSLEGSLRGDVLTSPLSVVVYVSLYRQLFSLLRLLELSEIATFGGTVRSVVICKIC